MKSSFKICLLSLLLLTALMPRAESQSIRLVGADVVNGAINGLAVGGATMALQNSKDQAPLRVGLGLGILYGIGTGIYDNSMVSKGEQFYTSATFNDGKNSTVIVLLDTFYGAIGGAAIGSAISLIGNEPVVDGLQYGSGAGAWIGFGFGLIDSFSLATRPNQLQASNLAPVSRKARGIVQVDPAVGDVSLGFLHPTVITRKMVHKNSVNYQHSLSIEVVNLRVDL